MRRVWSAMARGFTVAAAVALAALMAVGCPEHERKTWPTIWGPMLSACCYDDDGRHVDSGDTGLDTGEGQAQAPLRGQVAHDLGGQASPVGGR
jgi:hypothetical protein